MMAYLNAAYWKLSPDRLAQRHFPLEIISAVLDKDTGELMKYRKLTKNQNTATYITITMLIR